MDPRPLGVRNVPAGVLVYVDGGACWCEPEQSKCPWCSLRNHHRHLVDEAGEVSNKVQDLP